MNIYRVCIIGHIEREGCGDGAVFILDEDNIVQMNRDSAVVHCECAGNGRLPHKQIEKKFSFFFFFKSNENLAYIYVRWKGIKILLDKSVGKVLRDETYPGILKKL